MEKGRKGREIQAACRHLHFLNPALESREGKEV